MRNRATPKVALACVAAAALLVPAAAPAAPTVPSADPIVVISGPAAVGAQDVVEGVFVVHGDATIAGTVTGDVFVIDGDVELSGRVEGNLTTAAGRAVLQPEARVEGDLLYGDEAPQISPRASVGGEVSDEGWDGALDAAPVVGALVFWLAVGVSALVLGLALVLLVPRAADAVYAQARQRLLVSFLFGLTAFVALPVASVIAAITLVGLPLGLALLLAMLPLAAVGYVTSAWVLGRALVKRRGDRVIPFLVGLAILRALALIPFLGALVWLVAVIFGLGLLVAAVGASRTRPASPGPLAPEAVST